MCQYNIQSYTALCVSSAVWKHILWRISTETYPAKFPVIPNNIKTACETQRKRIRESSVVLWVQLKQMNQ